MQSLVIIPSYRWWLQPSSSFKIQFITIKYSSSKNWALSKFIQVIALQGGNAHLHSELKQLMFSTWDQFGRHERAPGVVMALCWWSVYHCTNVLECLECFKCEFIVLLSLMHPVEYFDESLFCQTNLSFEYQTLNSNADKQAMGRTVFCLIRAFIFFHLSWNHQDLNNSSNPCWTGTDIDRYEIYRQDGQIDLDLNGRVYMVVMSGHAVRHSLTLRSTGLFQALRRIPLRLDSAQLVQQYTEALGQVNKQQVRSLIK